MKTRLSLLASWMLAICRASDIIDGGCHFAEFQPHPKNCSSFYHCLSVQTINSDVTDVFCPCRSEPDLRQCDEKSCPTGQWFDFNSQKCTAVWKSDGECDCNFCDLKPSEDDESEFLQCSYSVQSVQECVSGTTFSYGKQVCDYVRDEFPKRNRNRQYPLLNTNGVLRHSRMDSKLTFVVFVLCFINAFIF